MQRTTTTFRYALIILLAIFLVAGLYLVSRSSYLLFHSIAELFSMATAGGVFMLAWNARRFMTSDYLLVIGIGALFAGIISLLHTLAYKGMGVFPGADANLPTQLWIASRYLTAFAFLAAPLTLDHRSTPSAEQTVANESVFPAPGWRLSREVILAGFAVVTGLLLASIFAWRIFPDCYVNGVGLTPFKKTSEFVISGMFLAGGGLLWLRRAKIDGYVFRLLMAATAVSIACDLAFTLYADVYDLANFTGHLLGFFAYFLLYRAIIETGLVRPYDLLFRDIKQAERELRGAHDELESRVAARTAELTQANATLAQHAQRLEILRTIDQAILAAKSPAEIAQAAVAHIRRGLGCVRVSVVLFDGADAPRLLAVDARPEMVLEPGAAAWLDALPPCASRERIEVVDLAHLDGDDEPARLAIPLLPDWARSYTSVPLRVEGRRIGALRLWTAEAGNLTAALYDFAAQVADSLAVAIQNARLFEQLAASRQQLQHLSRSLVEAQENQARQIGQDLHDDAGQALTTVKLGLGLIARHGDCPPELAARTDELRQMLDELMERLHDLAVSLRPVSLDRLGLVPALDQYAEILRRQTNLKIEMIPVGLDGERLPPEVETTLYRVVQEAITNVARHARASRVGIVVERRPAGVITIVEDDGVGFDPEEAATSHRLGLIGMRERVEMMGGEFDIESQPGQGATIIVSIPC